MNLVQNYSKFHSVFDTTEERRFISQYFPHADSNCFMKIKKTQQQSYR